MTYDYTQQGTGYDPGARGHELQGRRSAPSADDYERAFQTTRAQQAPDVDDFERRCGCALDRGKLERAARVLACPVKAADACWHHGRIAYAAARRFAEELRSLTTSSGGAPVSGRSAGPVHALDVGTAKGFSALCLLWALDDARVEARVTSVDVLDPTARVRRNTVSEVDGHRTLAEILEPWPEARRIEFLQSTGVDWLRSTSGTIDVAFVDGKHRRDVVLEEGRLLSRRQPPGRVAVFDDLQIPGVEEAVRDLERAGLYRFARVPVRWDRVVAVGVRQ